MLLEFARWIQSTALSSALAGSTWAYPVIGALHVLGLAWFGGLVLLAALRVRPRPAMLWTGAAAMTVSGILLVIIEPMRCLTSISFGVKLVLLLVLGVIGTRTRPVAVLLVWAAVIFASRGIAFF